MNKITGFFTEPFRRGPFWGVLDVAFKVFALFVWLFVMSLVIYFLYRTFKYDYIATNKIWWLSYSAVLTLTSSVLGYTALFVRK